MRSVSVVVLLVAVAMASSAPTSETEKPHYDVSNAAALFADYVQTHGKTYKDEDDRQVHFRAFVQSLEKINKLNAQGDSATYGLNKFADYTDEERKGMFGLRKPEN